MLGYHFGNDNSYQIHDYHHKLLKQRGGVTLEINGGFFAVKPPYFFLMISSYQKSERLNAKIHTNDQIELNLHNAHQTIALNYSIEAIYT